MPSKTATTPLQELWEILLAVLDKSGDSTRSGQEVSSIRGYATNQRCETMHLSAGQAYAIVKRGVPSAVLAPLNAFLDLGKGAAADYLDLGRAAATRKVARNEPLPTHAADSLLRLLELDGIAREAFESPEEAAGWLRRAHPMLDGESPLSCAKSGFGTQRVKEILAAIKYGGVV